MKLDRYVRVVAFLLLTGSAAGQSADYERARQLLTSGRAEEAAAVYQSLLRADPDNADLLLNLTIAEYKARRFREAADTAASALKRAPDLLPAKLFLGASYVELGEFGRAIPSLEFVVAANPRERNARLMLAEALLGSERADAAVEHFRAAAEMLPDDPRVWYGLARSHEALGQNEAAANAWERLLKLPPSLQSHLHLAEAHSAALRWRDAAVEWSAALKLAPDNLKARLGLAWSLFRSRDYEAALATLKPLPAERHGAEIEFLRGASLLNLGQPGEAMPYLRAAVTMDAALLSARAALGQALLQTGDAASAIPFLKSSVSVDPDGSLHFQLFRAYQLTGRKVEAQQALEAYRRSRSAGNPSQ